MLIHRHDQSDDEGRWRRFVQDAGFGQFVAAGRGRDLPVVVPTQYALREDEAWLHLARANPVFDALAEQPAALLSVAGDWAYIPGWWKAIAGEDPRQGIPTTYYAAVQLSGVATVVDDPEEIAVVLRHQFGEQEPDGDYVDPLAHGARLRTIRAIRLSITDVRAKFKFGGNVDAEHRRAVADRLAARDGPGDAAARSHLQQIGR